MHLHSNIPLPDHIIVKIFPHSLPDQVDEEIQAELIVSNQKRYSKFFTISQFTLNSPTQKL
jgi:hypothetical protein